MPKIIENVKEQLLREAERQIKEVGYAKTTIRSVAGAYLLHKSGLAELELETGRAK